MSNEGKHFNAEKIFFALFLFTAIEVAWGYLLIESGRVLLWGGLIFFAMLKALLIAQYFMHFKFEGWIIKSLIIPTPFLIAYVMVMISPDISRSDYLRAPVGSMLDREEGVVKVNMSELSNSYENTHGKKEEGEEH